MILLGVLFLLWFIIAYSKRDSQMQKFDINNTLTLSSFLCLGVMMTHIVPWFPYQKSFWNQFGIWGGIIVGMFFFKAGYGLNYSLSSKGHVYLKNFLIKKIFKIIIPLVLITIIWQLYLYFSRGNTIVEQYNAFIYDGSTFSPSSWFVYVLFLLYLLWWILNLLDNNKNRVSLIFYLLILLYCILIKKINWWGGYTLSIWAFPLGMSYQLVEDKLYNKIIQNRNGYLLVLFFIYILIFLYGIMAEFSFCCPGWWNLACNLLPILAVGLIYYTGFFQNVYIKGLGLISYEFYLVHACFITVYVEFIEPSNLHTLPFVVFVLLCSLIASYALKWLSALIISKKSRI